MKKLAFLIAAIHSGSGKTTLTLGLMAALKRRGLSVQPFKVGPDFIDPGHHTRIAGRQSRNLDGWMLSRSYNQNLFSRLVRDADCAVVEGVMGLFDGFDAVSDAGSTAQMAKWLGLPVLLIVNAASMARSAAAMVQGFVSFDPELKTAGVIFNRVGSERHLSLLREAVSYYCSVPCFGGLPRDERLVMPERHLGLVTREETTFSREDEVYLDDFVERHVDVDALLKACAIAVPEKSGKVSPASPPKIRIAVARDAAFCFYYPDNLEWLERFGAELVFFSPLKDEQVPEGCRGIYIGGGYPEEFAEALAGNEGMRASIRAAGERGCPIYAECGGLMYLSRGIVTREGVRYPMVGIFPFTTRMLSRFRALGYREVLLNADGPLGPPGLIVRGHEFHYSEISGEESEDLKRIYEVVGRKNIPPREEGFHVFNSLASYVHLHFGSNPKIAENWVTYCQSCGIST